MIAYEDFVAPGTWILDGIGGLPTPPPGLERYAPPGNSAGEARFLFKPLPRALREKILKGALFAPQAAPQQPDCGLQSVEKVHPGPDCGQQDSDEVASLSTGCSSSSSSSSRGRRRKNGRTLSDSGASTSSSRSLRSSEGRDFERLQATTSQCSPLPIHHAVSHHLVEPDVAPEFDSTGGAEGSHRREWLQSEQGNAGKPWRGDLPQLPVRYLKKPQRPREVSRSSFSALGLVA
eukprot:TRINITY_DN8781_c0_g3_i1.p1 TRINITY_DN8781_c0_g3~~TRINITY_DN8781_c0_g3_i1.p1  ORF type:complete len:234 (+),score=34.28 TRINITY_DN8781_c0_g3_i1:95-796(+)